MDQNNDDLCPSCQDIDYRERMCEPCRLKCRIFDLIEYNKALEEDNEVLKVEIEKTYAEWERLKIVVDGDVSTASTIKNLKWALEEQRNEIKGLQLKLNNLNILNTNNGVVDSSLMYFQNQSPTASPNIQSDIEFIKNFGKSTEQYLQAVITQGLGLNSPQPYSRGTPITPKVQSIKDKDLEDALDMYNKRAEQQKHATLDMDNTSYDDIDDIIANMK